MQVHLALVAAIDARVMLLDEPTLGLDILSRCAFGQAFGLVVVAKLAGAAA